MPLNLIKIYNQLLDIVGMDVRQRTESLMGIFRRDFVDNAPTFMRKSIHPTPIDGKDKMENLFHHITTHMVDKTTRKRDFEMERSIRLHWIRHHLEQRKQDNMLIFSVKEPEGNRTYIYDRDEKYVVILEPLRIGDAYYFITAYHLEGKDDKRNKIEKKYKRRLDNIL